MFVDRGEGVARSDDDGVDFCTVVGGSGDDRLIESPSRCGGGGVFCDIKLSLLRHDSAPFSSVFFDCLSGGSEKAGDGVSSLLFRFRFLSSLSELLASFSFLARFAGRSPLLSSCFSAFVGCASVSLGFGKLSNIFEGGIACVA